jgi:DNA replication and repair protein RecF
MARTVLTWLSLRDFRSYTDAALALDGRPVALCGANGAGKTNILEAVSYLAPGKGLRGAAVTEIGRRLPGEAAGRAWSVSAVVAGQETSLRVGTGLDADTGAARRIVRIEGETAAPGRLAEVVRLVWLTPAQDRLFLEGGTERRRFLDRLVFAAEPAHATVANTYDRTLRERMRLLTDGPADPAWLDALEARLGEAGIALARARSRTLDALQAEIDGRADRPFPQADLQLSGEWARPSDSDAPQLASAFATSRARDAAAGRALAGPHRTDLQVRHREKDRPASECSTGEQKALVLNLVLAQAQRLARAESSPNPILLLDEVAAHLDPSRRVALFEEITALGLHVFLTGTERALFQYRPGWAQAVEVDAARLTPLHD